MGVMSNRYGESGSGMRVLTRPVFATIVFPAVAKLFLEPERESKIEMNPRIPNPAFKIAFPVKPH
jgi:hypothetical protein